MNDARPFSERLLAARKALGLTQSGVAAVVGRDKQTVSNWECGRYKPDRLTQRAVIQALTPRR